MTAGRRRPVPPCIAALAVSLAAGCAVGPDFKRPAAPDVHDYRVSPASATVTAAGPGGEAQRFL
ncbi:MAG TPA: RND transporter, partial [Steroidobacteraceae bacterium]|nr:RND transporter [Steroidobacteraceae bacterium]